MEYCNENVLGLVCHFFYAFKRLDHILVMDVTKILK